MLTYYGLSTENYTTRVWLGGPVQPDPAQKQLTMRFFSSKCLMIMTLLLVDAFRAPLKKGGLKNNKGLKKGGGHVLKVIGETGLGVVSLSAALAILNSLEADTDPSDAEMMSLIGAERERLLSLNSSSWETPLACGGSAAGISVLVICVCLIRIIRNRKSSNQGEVKETRTVTVSAVKEQNSGLQFGDVSMKNLQSLDI